MNETEVIQYRNEEENIVRHPSGLLRVLKVIGLTLIWAFVSAGIVGALAAAVWTVIPTDMLSWGATKVNLIGYVSHCPFVPVSTMILLSTVGVLSVVAYKLKRVRNIGLVVFTGTAVGLLVGLLGGIDVTMYMGMGSGVAVGVMLGLVVGLIRNTGE
ncbi:MAG: hypothetical protein ACFFE2_14665 [Candidatus Thorarchaeota archaeon]